VQGEKREKEERREINNEWEKSREQSREQRAESREQRGERREQRAERREEREQRSEQREDKSEETWRERSGRRSRAVLWRSSAVIL
jgi:hypothetical protein